MEHSGGATPAFGNDIRHWLKQKKAE